ncbi:hypothetical protein KGF56_001719 [Candida oxycetoniae]|uniref:Uncharacterized protein n=1 Tax=Candida oxycetoniae TaxID=497107 RepID=A0AAI9SYS0_9ASCO|nr:uncharacterized protein KGF56_001719 [Candida oxycetoniae]KAI3405472.2 hypothetical protein KGF56_001719 [Candida oxycetoniae]
MMLRSGLRGVKVFRQLYNFLPQRNYGTVPAKTGVPAIHQSISKSVKREMSTLKEVSTLKESTLSGKEVPGKEVSTLKESTLSGKEVPGKELSLLKVSSNGSRDFVDSGAIKSLCSTIECTTIEQSEIVVQSNQTAMFHYAR